MDNSEEIFFLINVFGIFFLESIKFLIFFPLIKILFFFWWLQLFKTFLQEVHKPDFSPKQFVDVHLGSLWKKLFNGTQFWGINNCPVCHFSFPIALKNIVWNGKQFYGMNNVSFSEDVGFEKRKCGFFHPCTMWYSSGAGKWEA